MLSQGRHLRTLFVPDSVSETVAPQSIVHYLSQRRRWGSNAFFNNYFYTAGEKMILFTRISAFIEVVRLNLVYYRVLNTALFIHGLATEHVSILQLIPMLIIGQFPSMWFFISVMIDPELRIRAHKLVLGFLINKIISPFMSVTIFTKVALNLGSQGMSKLHSQTLSKLDKTNRATFFHCSMGHVWSHSIHSTFADGRSGVNSGSSGSDSSCGYRAGARREDG